MKIEFLKGAGLLIFLRCEGHVRHLYPFVEKHSRSFIGIHFLDKNVTQWLEDQETYYLSLQNAEVERKLLNLRICLMRQLNAVFNT